MHCPTLPGTAHDLQVPEHAVVQQTCCEQNPDAHSLAAVQPAPGGLGPQLPLTHAAGATQSALVTQIDRQLPVGSHWYWPHELVAAAMQSPVPSQRDAFVTEAAMHDCARQIAPAAYSAHAPAPSHAPVWPQAAMPSSAQSPPGSVPTASFTQVPSIPATLHD